MNSKKLFPFLVGAMVVVLLLLISKSKKEGFYNNPTTYYPGCNPLLYTQCPGCNGCGMSTPGCWRESDICATDRYCDQDCSLFRKQKSCF